MESLVQAADFLAAWNPLPFQVLRIRFEVQSLSNASSDATAADVFVRDAEWDLSGAYGVVQLAGLSVLLLFLLSRLRTFLRVWLRDLRDRGPEQFFKMLKSLPYVRRMLQKEQDKVLARMREATAGNGSGDGVVPMLELPLKSMAADEIRSHIRDRTRRDVKISDGFSTVSGTVYIKGEEHRQLLNEVYCAFSHTNPLHPDIFPSVRRMEAEVIAMAASLLGGGPNGNDGVCGAMTSGGTESIVTAVKACRDYMRETRGITAPEIIVAVSAHAAYFKAAEWLKLRLVKLPVGKDYRLSADAVRRAITKNTVLVVASAPGYPHGVVDDVEGIARVTRRHGVLLHVDACLGGFLLPFARALNYPVPKFDFSVPGVTSMSVDTHKYGMTQKGTSIILYYHPELRRHQYTSITEWTGGLYISPGLAGSRSGALIAQAWAGMLRMGQSGYLEAAKQIMEASCKFRDGVNQTPGLEVCGNPDGCVVAFRSASRKIDVYKVNDLMSKKGWHLNALQRPPAVHVCITAQHVDIIDQLLQDLQSCVKMLSEDGSCGEGGLAAIYGTAATIPDRRMVGDLLALYQDVLLSP